MKGSKNMKIEFDSKNFDDLKLNRVCDIIINENILKGKITGLYFNFKNGTINVEVTAGEINDENI